MKIRDISDLLILAALWGGSFLFMRAAVPQFGPVPLIELRVLIAALFLLPVLQRKIGFRQLRENWRPLLVIGLTNSALPFSLFAFATLSLTAGFAAILNAASPLFSAIIAGLWLKEKFTPARVAGLIIGFSGVLVLVWGNVSFKPGGSGLAIVASLLATICYGFAANFTRKRVTGVDPMTIAAGSQLWAAIILILPALWLMPAQAPRLDGWISVALLAIACTGLAYILYFRLIANAGPTNAISVTFLIPVFGMLWGAWFLGEPVTLRMIAGCVVILIGTALTTGLLTLRARQRSLCGDSDQRA